jgi:hypothetical protein
MDPDPKSDFDELVSTAEKIRSEYLDICQAEWAASPLNWIRQVSSANKKGKIGERLVMAWADTSGFAVRPRVHRGHDCVIAGAKVEVKLSLRWNSGTFTFMEIRDFDYDIAALLGIAPTDVYLWIVPKHILLSNAPFQRRGASGKGSQWVQFPSGRPPEYLRSWGGTFAQAREVLTQARQYRTLN